MGQLTASLDSLVFQFLEFLDFVRINLNGIDWFTVDADFGLELNDPTGRFSPYGQRADKLTCHRYFWFLGSCWEANARKR
jgi:hypothetical protein